jgi:hypothetical protein
MGWITGKEMDVCYTVTEEGMSHLPRLVGGQGEGGKERVNVEGERKGGEEGRGKVNANMGGRRRNQRV